MEKLTLFLVVFYGPTLPLALVSYVITKRGTQRIKNIWIALFWLWYIVLPFRGASNGALPRHSYVTLLVPCWSFVYSLKVTQMVLFPRKLPKKDDPEEKTTKYPRPMYSGQMSLKEALKFCGSCIYFAFPVDLVRDNEKRRFSFVFKQITIQIIFVALKIFQMFFFTQFILKLSQQYPSHESRGHPVIYIEMLVFFSFVLISASHVADINGMVVRLLSLGRYEMLPTHRYPFISTSMREMWSHRYNLPITHLLRETVYEPLQTYFQWSRNSSSLATFVMSGLLHAYSSYFTFGHGVVRTFTFFAVQAPWIAFVEPQIRGWNKRIRQVLTLMFFYLSFVLYGGLFVEAMPNWIYRNCPVDQDPPFPFLIKLVDMVATSKFFGLPSSAEMRQMSEVWQEAYQEA